MRVPIDATEPIPPPVFEKTVDEMIADMGGWERVREEHQAYMASFEVYLENFDVLLQSFPNQWVAWADGRLLGTNAFLPDLREGVLERRGTIRDVYFAYMRPKPLRCQF